MDELIAAANRRRMLKLLADSRASLAQAPQRAPASVVPEESSMQQAVREFPGDVADAFSPTGLANSAARISGAARLKARELMAEYLARKAK